MFYKNIVIKDNVIKNADYHGITVGETIGVVISNNTVLQNSDSGSVDDIPGINVEEESLKRHRFVQHRTAPQRRYQRRDARR